jgi:16S rRNA (guanine966-N2)-methyltransferase
MLRQSAEQLQLDTTAYQMIQGTAEQVLTQNQLTQRHFGVVFIDPPYAQDLWQPILTSLITQSLINTDTLIYLEADKDLDGQLTELANTLNEGLSIQQPSNQATIGFDCLKQTKVGQVVAGLYQLSSS